MGDRSLRRAVFLDRDGVLNEPVVRDGRPYPPASVDELHLCPGAADALARLRELDFLLIVVTNQPDIVRGHTAQATVTAIHEALRAQLPLDAFYTCAHDDADACACRKPKPGLIVQAASDYAVDLGRSYVIGDRWRDVAAGAAAGVTTVFIDRAYREARPDPPADFDAPDIASAAAWIQARERTDHAAAR